MSSKCSVGGISKFSFTVISGDYKIWLTLVWHNLWTKFKIPPKEHSGDIFGEQIGENFGLIDTKLSRRMMNFNDTKAPSIVPSTLNSKGNHHNCFVSNIILTPFNRSYNLSICAQLNFERTLKKFKKITLGRVSLKIRCYIK